MTKLNPYMDMSKKTTNIIVYSYEEGMRLGRFLLKISEKVPKSMIYKLIRKKDIRINNRKTDFDYRLKTDDVISIRYFDIVIHKNKYSNIEKIKKYIIYEDSDMIVIDKPAGISVHSGTNPHKDLLEYLPYFGNFKPSPINRIDKDTSGIVLFGKSYRFTKAAKENWKYCMKSYLAVLDNRSGILRKGSTVVVKDSLEKKVINGYEKMVESSNGKESILKFRVLSIDKDKALILIHLHTGRTHQVRCQFSLLGVPVTGDKKYGYKGPEKSLHLLSYRLLLAVPRFEKRIFKIVNSSTHLPIYPS